MIKERKSLLAQYLQNELQNEKPNQENTQSVRYHTGSTHSRCRHTDCRSPELHIHFREADSHSIGSRQPQPERQAGHEKRGAYLFLNIPPLRSATDRRNPGFQSHPRHAVATDRHPGIIQKGRSGGQPHRLPAATENQHPPPGAGTCRYLRL